MNNQLINKILNQSGVKDTDNARALLCLIDAVSAYGSLEITFESSCILREILEGLCAAIDRAPKAEPAVPRYETGRELEQKSKELEGALSVSREANQQLAEVLSRVTAERDALKQEREVLLASNRLLEGSWKQCRESLEEASQNAQRAQQEAKVLGEALSGMCRLFLSLRPAP